MNPNYGLMVELKPEFQKELFKDLYLNKKLSTSKIANLYKCNPETVRRYLIKLKIPRRKIHQRIYKISKKEIYRLYNKERKSTLEIAKLYGCSQWTIWSLLNKYNIEARDANDYHKWKAPPNQIKPTLDITPNLSYIIAVILGDGWIYKRGYCYFVCLQATDKIFCYKFKESLNKIGLKPSMFKRKNCWRVIASSKIFYEWFESLKDKDIEEIAKKYPIEFIRGFYESEGNFSIYKSKKYNFISSTITILNTNKEYINLIKELLEYLNFHPTLHKRNNKYGYGYKPIWALSIARKLEVKRFLELIKPCIKKGEKRRNRNV